MNSKLQMVNNSKLHIVKLREFNDSDIARVAELCDNKKIWINVRDIFPSPYTLKDAEFFIGLCNNAKPATTFAIEFNSELVGCIGLELQSDIHKKSAELGYWIGEPYWGKGIASQAVPKLVEFGFETFGLNRIYACVYDYNKASCRVLEKSGFQLEGILRKAVYKNESFCDEYRYAIIRE